MQQLSPELLEAIVGFLPSKDMAVLADALPTQLRTPPLQLVATLTQALGHRAFSRGLDLGLLAQLGNADRVLDQLSTTTHTLCVNAPTKLLTVPEVATPPLARPTLRHLCLDISDWTDDRRVLACLRHVLAANAASLQSIEVHFSAPSAMDNWRNRWQHDVLTTLVHGLVSLPHVTSLSLRSDYALRFPDTEAATLGQWIDATPLTSLRMEHVYEPARGLWAKPTLTSLTLDPMFQLDSSAAFGHALTHVDLCLFDWEQLEDLTTTLVHSPIESLTLQFVAGASRQDELATQAFLDDALPRLNQLTTLRLTNVHLSATHCLTLALLLPRYNHLGLTSNGMGDAGVLALAPFLRHTSQLETLTLVDQGFGDVGASALAAALVHTPRLRTLDLGRNDIKISGVMALSGLLPHLPRLETWRLCKNPLGAKGLVFLLRAWTYVELDTTTLIDARDTIGSEDDARDCDALIGALPRHRRCLAATETPPTETQMNRTMELLGEPPSDMDLYRGLGRLDRNVAYDLLL